jgi:hypothetical protein
MQDAHSAAFAATRAALAAAAPKPNDPDPIDYAVEDELAGWTPLMEPLVTPLLSLADECQSFEEFAARLPEALKAQNPAPLAEALAMAGMEWRMKGWKD